MLWDGRRLVGRSEYVESATGSTNPGVQCGVRHDRKSNLP
jgi:hypothetical protein